MSEFNIKDVLAASIAYQANNKASREINHEGNNVSGFSTSINPGSNFDKYLNTYLALIDYVEKHDKREAVLDKLSVDPTEYQIKPIFNTLVSASKVMLAGASVLQQPLFAYKVQSVGDIMTPSYFNAYQNHFKMIGDDKLFAGVTSFNPESVTFSDIKAAVDGDNLYIINPDGKIDPEISMALGISLPISDLSKYAALDKELSKEDVVVWLTQQGK